MQHPYNTNKMIVFKRKIYTKLLEFRKAQGSYALLIEGARRIGKSTIVKEFARKEYSSFIFIDFSECSQEVLDMFEDISNLEFFFLKLQTLFGVNLTVRDSLIVFDEVQFAPKARQAIKRLVADGRYDYIETGYLISINKNVQNILIPSEERSIQMFPMDFDEFQWAIGMSTECEMRNMLYQLAKPVGDAVHRKLMRNFRLYLLVGGMPQAIVAYINTNSLYEVDIIKRQILALYEKDFMKIDPSGRIAALFNSIPAQLTNNTARFRPHSVSEASANAMKVLINELLASKTVEICRRTTDPGVLMNSYYDPDCYKLFIADTGLFVTLAFKDADFTDNILYNKMLNDKLDANLGYIYENAVAQIIAASGKKLFYYTFANENDTGLYEIDFLLSSKNKVNPLEVKSSSNLRHASLDAFIKKYSSRIKQAFLISPKDRKTEGQVINIPFYLLPNMLQESTNTQV